MADKDKIDIKDVTGDVTGTFNPNTFKAGDDRFNPGNRIYVRSQTGYWQRVRKAMGWFFVALFVLLPWLRYDGRQAVLFDLEHQQFHIFGATIWPQDLTLLAWVFMIAAFALFFVTTFLGRVWCGYLCPQTVWTFLFIWFEEKLEGAANKRRKLDAAPWSGEKLARKGAKHLAWILLSLGTGLTFVAYFQDVFHLVPDFFTPAGGRLGHLLGAVLCRLHLWQRRLDARHHVYPHVPYARFQSAMFDKDTYIVGYDSQRGETRGARGRKADPKALGLGTASTATSACRSARPVSTSVTVCSTSASTAAPVSTPATRPWSGWGIRKGSSVTPPSTSWPTVKPRWRGPS